MHIHRVHIGYEADFMLSYQNAAVIPLPALGYVAKSGPVFKSHSGSSGSTFFTPSRS